MDKFRSSHCDKNRSRIANVYQELINAEQQVESYPTDLYVKKTPESEAILEAARLSFSAFFSPVDKAIWYDVPFMVTPFWAELKRDAVALGK